MIDLSQVTDIMLGNAPVEQVSDSRGNVLWSAAVAMKDYFYVEDISGSDNTLSIKKQGSSAPDIEVFCSSDQKNWTSMGTTSTTAITATVPANGKLYLRATANKWGANSFQYNYISASGNHNVGGNIMSLLYNEDFENQTLFPAGSTYTFFYFFKSDPNLINAENLVLPATTLTNYCYGNMFNSCSSLTAAPATLPATTLAQSCYQSMFYNCSSLTAAPALPATTLAQGCYQDMFSGCTSLTTAPELPATTLASSCYNGMFYGCTSLTTAPELPVTTLATSCYNGMFYNCTSLTQAPALPAQLVPQSAYSGMFRNCTSLVTAPALPATTLNNYCYSSMFQGCTSLTTAPTLPATTLANNCYSQMFYGCSALTQAPALPATTLANYCYSQMFSGCTSLTSAPALPATNLTNNCYKQMFSGCTSLTSTPELPATTLAANSYSQMFSGCTNLNSVVTYAQDISASGCLFNWLQSVAATGDFYNLGSATYTADSASGIPAGWSEWTSLPEYFYIEDISGSDNTVSIAKSNTDSPTIEVFYSTDKQNWSSMGTTSTTAITATVPANGKLYLKTTTNAWNQNKITASGNHNVGGNIMSLLYGDNYGKQKTFPSGSTNTFRSLFVNNTNLINAENLILPATTMVQDGYRSLFYGCTGLVTAPALPATTMAQECYRSLFYNCTSLTQAPALPATTLALGCYSYMFYGCSALTQAPALPATTLAQGCYTYMFYNCTSLNEITTCANDISAPMCLLGWVENVAATGDFYNKGTATYTTGVSGIPTGWTLHNVGEYFYVEDISGSDNTLSIERSDSSVPAIVVFKSTDKVNWTSMGTTSTSYIRATIPANGKLYLKATANSWGVGSSGTIITTSGNHNVGGNIMSLLYGDNYENTNLPVGNFGTFCNLFKNDTTLVNAQDLILPATTLTANCYGYMFYGCTGLVTAPVLPATTLAYRCYEDMFEGCTSLTQAPVLSATTLDTQCYEYMFRGCTSLTTAPVLPAITLTDYCYRLMFQGCTNLNKVTTYAQDISASNCLLNWLDNVAATGDFYNMGTATYTTDSPSGIPTGWVEHRNSANEYFYLEDISGAANTVTFKKNNANAPNVSISVSTDKVNWTNIGVPYTPGITATIPANGKLYVKATTERWGSSYYNYMTASGNHNIGGNIMSLLYGDNFQGQTTVFTCSFTHLFYTDTNLVNAEDLVLPAATMAEECYYGMFQNCTSLVTAPTLSATTLTRSCYSQMFYGCTALTQAPALPATTLATACYYEMFNGCTSLTSTPELPATTLAANCYQNMFSGCTSLTTAPELPATTLANYCYSQMFSGCTNLNSVVTYAQDISASSCLLNWLKSVAATGDFYNLGNPAPTYPSGASGIPSGWTEHTSL